MTAKEQIAQMHEDLGVALGLPHHETETFTWPQLIAQVAWKAGELHARRDLAQPPPQPSTRSSALQDARRRLAEAVKGRPHG